MRFWLWPSVRLDQKRRTFFEGGALLFLGRRRFGRLLGFGSLGEDHRREEEGNKEDAGPHIQDI